MSSPFGLFFVPHAFRHLGIAEPKAHSDQYGLFAGLRGPDPAADA